MKFIQYVEKVTGIHLYGMSSLLIFSLFFIIMLIWVFRTNKKQFDEVSKMPLDN
jgi:cytochrome c oxidase cbb3-type subunit IV